MLAQPIDLVDSEEEPADVMMYRKLQYHMGELEKEKRGGDFEEITEGEQGTFLSICDSYIQSLPRN